ncbi:FAS1 domain-containing protein [Fusarium flagelliforme]|uniref:Transforming growth factor-beta-induced protein ig-h3 n=1 Tax=Fusarium flagelliforme TaxID=2675880 RepID=A0A395MMF9_9HYPO|nr:FAS1 domain-containing protein [Fusarium flagelliforme]KAH7185705.1 FAS1 domain-containing protein [Fusarium flagelliforme]RFN49128.1 transforming growth factor-beta-induced protein ig-h3 [Fusarium flagelliforme]
MFLIRTLAGIASLFALAEAADTTQPMDLGSVLGRHPKLSTYYKLIQKFPDILLQLPSYDGVTIVAPSNDAFEQIPYTALSKIWDPSDAKTTIPLLQYHILQGTVSAMKLKAGPAYVKPTLLMNPKWSNVTAGQNILINKQPDDVVFSTRYGNRATVINYDIKFQGGLIQIVDSLLIPPSGILQVLMASKVESFLGGLFKAGLMPGLSDRNDITVFAPRDQAMENVGSTLNSMSAKELARVMGYHIVPGKVLVSTSLVNDTSLNTLAGEKTYIRQVGNEKFINSAKIITTDILISNGILHIISNVNNPMDADAVPNPTMWAQAPVFRSAQADDVFHSAIPCTADCPVTNTPTPTPADQAENNAATTPWFTTRSSTGVAAARATAQIAGAALGIMGVGAGMAFL